MAYQGQPIPSTVLPISQIKVSDGKSVDVTVPAGTGVEAGEFCVIDGFFGVSLQKVNKDENTNGTLIALQTEQAEYITTQIDTSKTFAIGSALYYDSATKKLTDDSSVSGAILVGRITSAKDKNNVIQFVLYPQNVSTINATSSITVDNSLSKSGQAADSKKVGDELAKKLNKPADGNGTSGQLLKTNGDGTTIWFTPEKLDHIANATGENDAHTVLNSLLSALQEKGFMKTE
jgi:hypothetical protein